MLKITIDMFSGRPNPSWILADEAEARKLLKEISKERELLAKDEADTAQVLGFRGVSVEVLGDDSVIDTEMPTTLYLPARLQASTRGQNLIERVIDLTKKADADLEAEDQGGLPFGDEFYSRISQELEEVRRVSDFDMPEQPGEKEDEASAADRGVCCRFERGTFNPGFWNRSPTQRSNNCYNYATNRRTDTFAQPGRGAGSIYKEITAAEVSRAAMADGVHRRFDCFADTERPRWLVALVIKPDTNPRLRDYHWYRLSREGYWGHKPGSTKAINTDNKGAVIYNVKTCDRGGYTEFAGYFYTCKTQWQRIK